MQLIDKNGNIVEAWETTEEAYTIQADLEIGEEYTIHEVEAPEGYELALDKTIIIKDTEEVQTFTIVDVKKPNKIVVQISKYSDNNELLPGAKIQLLDSDNNVIEEWITDGNVYTVKKELTIGNTYTIHEEEAPAGYELASDITFTVKDTNDVQEFKMIDVKKLEPIVSPDTSDTRVIKYVLMSILSIIAIIIGGFAIKKINKKTNK